MATNDSQGGAGSGGNSFGAQHATPARQPLNVAPTDGSSKFNTIRIPLIPVACWRLNDPAFAFDSSFVSPSFKNELSTLSRIVAANRECPAALFGHCDPAGSDALNKTLGDRRAIAIYGLLTRQPDLWAYLYDNPQVGDRWSLPMVQTMLANVPDGQGNPYYGGSADGVQGPKTTDAVKRFQADSGQTSDGDPGAKTRRALYGAYMDWICTLPAPVAPAGDSSASASQQDETAAATLFRMQVTDFLGGAGAKDGDLPKMSLQSCGKFNPLVLLTTSEMNESDTTSRNADDAANRRVIMYFFDKGTKVDLNVWPCPKVKEANDACKHAFWPEGDKRRQNGDKLRLYEQTRDTMACRFYDRFARRSPCERVPPHLDWISFYVPEGCETHTMSLRFVDSQGQTLQKTAYTNAPTAAYTGRSFDLMPLVNQGLYAVQLYSGTQALEHPIRIDLGAYDTVASATPAGARGSQGSSQDGSPDAAQGSMTGDNQNVPVATAHDVDSSTKVA